MQSGFRVARPERGAERVRGLWCSCRRIIPTSRQRARSRCAPSRRSRSCGAQAGWGFGQLDVAVAVDHLLERLDLSIWAPCRAIANPHQAQDAEGGIDRPPAIDDAREQITGKERRGCALRLDLRQENFEAVIHAQPLGGESFALWKASDDAPKSRHGARSGSCLSSVNGQPGVASRQSPFMETPACRSAPKLRTYCAP
jgi:hypothetical protein